MFALTVIIARLFLLVNLVLHVSSGQEDKTFPCDGQPTLDLSDSEINIYNEIIKDGIVFNETNYVKYFNGTILGCVCRIMDCVYKCCPFGYNMFNLTNCVESDHFNIDELYRFANSQLNLSHLHIVHKPIDCLDLDTARFIINVGPNGIRTIVIDDIRGFEEDRESFCVDYFEDENRFAGVVCVEGEGNFNVHTTGMIISMPFLIATFLVYALLPDKNLPAKSLMCYVLSLLFAYIMLVTIQLNSNLEHGACVTIAYLCYFFFMVSFFWMNSSCIDIWLTFSGIKGITGQRTQERKRFIYYCLYSWGLPLIMTSIVVVMTMEHLKDSIFFTAIGDGQCWFKNGLSTGIYFYFPIAILLITNIVLFAITALKIRNVQRDTKVLNAKDSSKHEKDKQRIDEYNSEPCYLIEPVKNRGMQVYDFLDVDNSCLGFNLYIKLLFAMGVNWSMEVISWLVQWQSNNVPTYIWYITDFCNAMYGVLIFFIFVFKKNIWIMLKKRYLQIMGRSTRAHSMGTSTHRTTLFTAISLQSIPGAGLLTKMHSTPNDNRNELRPPKIH
ncbi:G-protein coupled receptor Mth2-like isoform X5 [Onthophagus taurus]|uniref:G-protein coupled receptor Mth2-like isoform X5 n=1 Tax=Onthophagus taurus TaxID=166361 RepID=UPI000C206656|nr:G-protein coupled receptor Mth2-like isoform X5 [Onthophagus taurus]